jgi:hypothetical protein
MARSRRSCPEPRNRGHADVVRSGEVFQGRALRAALAGLRLLLQGERRGAAHMLAARLGAAPAFRHARADKIALHVGKAAKDGNHQAPGAGGGVGPRLGQRAELPARVHDALDGGEQVESRACEAVDPRHCLCFQALPSSLNPPRFAMHACHLEAALGGASCSVLYWKLL